MVREEVANHQAVAHAPSTLRRIRLVRAGKQLDGRNKVFGAAYRLLDLAAPSPTVTRSGFRDFVHPRANRLCTVRELARLQTFPDHYVFRGRRCDTYAKSRYVQQTQHEQVGNAVPPLLAQALARAIRKHLRGASDSERMRSGRRHWMEAYEILDRAYPTDLLGNKTNPLDELIYVVLSRRTREKQYQKAYAALRREYRPWIKMLRCSLSELRSALRPIGLSNQRAVALRATLRAILNDFGRLTLSPLKRMTYSEAYHYLRSLPGVNDKTAKCVLLYSLGLPALPVDTHTFRVSMRLGLLPQSASVFTAPRQLEAIVPRNQRGRFHVLTVLHGRSVCTAKKPACHTCPVRGHCATGKVARSDRR